MPICEGKGCENDGTVEWTVEGRKGLLCEMCKHLAQIDYLEFPGWEDERGRSRGKREAAREPEAKPVAVEGADADELGEVPEL